MNVAETKMITMPKNIFRLSNLSILSFDAVMFFQVFDSIDFNAKPGWSASSTLNV
jgi:hypothetical protein